MVMMMTMMRLSSHWPLSPDSRPSLASEWERASDLIVVIIQQLHQSTIIDIIIHVKNLKPKMRTPVHNVERGQASPSEASFSDVASKSSGYVYYYYYYYYSLCKVFHFI